ncbi:MMPL family transporter [Actinophytocola oryzae]|uniref:RND superfamily putative drug exporter n=1 Tax=Actinophytocola oryzae TaxID=502181 RepID=A0A4R7W4W5_9PSEU|nr:MMPL family transporter [Actinophytocola oryzae]TDV57245.1 RND superfamily putative drug exporter [Actinophytocola oryzae]
MATFLYRLGRASFRRRWLVTGIWAAVLIIVGIGALGLSGTMSNAVTIPGTESQQAIDHLKKTFPEAHIGGGTARVVLEAPEGQDFVRSPANQAEVRKVVAALNDAPEVIGAADPFQMQSISRDGRLALVQVSYAKQAFALTDADREALVAAAHSTGLHAEIGGDAVRGAPETGATEILGVAVAAIVLVITFGSLLAAGLPLLTALVGVGIGLCGLLVLTGFTELNNNTPVLALMIGLAVGIDYALFIVSRYRNELGTGLDHEHAVGRAVGTAGSAVVFAGLTVIVALAGLTVVGIPFLGEMGLAAAATVVIAVLIATTLLPAILGFVGDRVRGRLPGLRGGPKPGRASMGERWARFVGRHRVAALGLAVVGVAVIAIPAASMQLGLPNDSTAAPESSQHKAYELVSEGFGPGANGPLIVVVDTSFARDPRTAVTDTAKRVDDLGVAAVLPPRVNKAGDTAILNVIPRTGPSEVATEDLVARIRAVGAELHDSTGATISVTGQTAANIDVSQKLSDAMIPYLALIVGLAFVLLMLVFRSVLVPLKATIGFLASLAATFGAVVAVFQWGWLTDLLGVESTGPIMSMLPILMIGVLFGLAMDYQVFLVTRMREDYVHGTEPREAVVSGFSHGARVVVAAALIMTSVFAGFVFAEDTLIQSIGFALAVGIAVDAFVVRMTIVPAVMSMLGGRAWWLPRWLDRVLPNVDVEGAGLVESPGGGEPPRERVPATV